MAPRVSIAHECAHLHLHAKITADTKPFWKMENLSDEAEFFFGSALKPQQIKGKIKHLSKFRHILIGMDSS